MSDTPSKPHLLQISADQALLEGAITGLVTVLYQNERPPQGLAGRLDWHFQGALSECLRLGKITGALGEVTYFPVNQYGRVLHVLCVGGGENSHAAGRGARLPLAPESLSRLSRNLETLKLGRMGLSCADFGQSQSDPLPKPLKGFSLWLAP